MVTALYPSPAGKGGPRFDAPLPITDGRHHRDTALRDLAERSLALDALRTHVDTHETEGSFTFSIAVP